MPDLVMLWKTAVNRSKSVQEADHDRPGQSISVSKYFTYFGGFFFGIIFNGVTHLLSMKYERVIFGMQLAFILFVHC